MARRKKGRKIHGWLNLHKPRGVTSTAMVNKARWAFGAQKAGHAGTLDPEATGVLAIAFGEATKTIPYITDALKAYRFVVKWGEATNTDDTEGEVIARSDVRPSSAAINQAIAGFTGDILQVPPKFSAVKVDGERAYALARDGEDVTLHARALYVESLALVGEPDADHAELEMVCGKGGYVRSVARDLGEALGCYGHVTELCRIWSGPFDLQDAVSAEVLESGPNNTDLDQYLLPLELGLADLPEQKVGPEGAARIRNGNSGPVTYSDIAFGEECWVSYEGQPIAVGIYRAGHVDPSRVFVFGNEP